MYNKGRSLCPLPGRLQRGSRPAEDPADRARRGPMEKRTRADYARQRADFSAPELERGLNVYRNVTDLHYDNDELPGAADIRDGKVL